MKKLFIASLALAALALSGVAFAQLSLPKGVESINTLYDTTVCYILQWVFTVAIILSVAFALVAAFKYMTSGGSEEKTTSARKTIQWAAVGVAIAILARGFPAIVASLFPSAGVNSITVCNGGASAPSSGAGFSNPNPIPSGTLYPSKI